jgi:hypothetical protein
VSGLGVPERFGFGHQLVGQRPDLGLQLIEDLRKRKITKARACSLIEKVLDLIDGERLIELLQEYGLGIRQLTVVDERFFAPFR